MDNERTIRYTIKEDGFEYHFLKQEMRSGKCRVSKSRHPVEEVEKLKRDLLQKGHLMDRGEYYGLRKNFTTSCLMARNLCSDHLIPNCSDIKYPIRIHDQDKEIVDYFQFKNVVPISPGFNTNVYKHELKFIGVSELSYNKSFFERSHDKGFSPSESFVAEVLERAKVINDYRRGDTDSNEADIVSGNKQIEVAICFNEALGELRSKEKSGVQLILDSVDYGRYVISNGVLNKFLKKKYSKDYETSLALLFVGSKTTAKSLMNELGEQLINKELKTLYTSLYFIIIEPVEDKVILSSSCEVYEEMPIDNISISPYSKKECTLEDLRDEGNYFMKCRSIFNNQEFLFLLSGKEIKENIKEMSIWVSGASE